MQPDPAPLAVIPKNSKEEVHVALSTFKGKNLIDVRVYAQWGDDPAPRPTRNGVSLNVDRLPDLIRALQEAASQAGVSA